MILRARKEGEQAVFGSALWVVETELGDVFISCYKNQGWCISPLISYSEIIDWLEEKKIDDARFPTKKEALECLETYLREDGYLK